MHKTWTGMPPSNTQQSFHQLHFKINNLYRLTLNAGLYLTEESQNASMIFSATYRIGREVSIQHPSKQCKKVSFSWTFDELHWPKVYQVQSDLMWFML